MEKVYTFLSENIEDDYIVVGVSGGVDSMVLLSFLKENIPSKIVCAHIHHNLRIESDEELEFVKDYCTNNDIIFESKKLEYDGKFSEEIARDMRYAFYEEILNKYQSKTLLTAHHGDDLIETVMMKIVRGSTIKGYSGISKVSQRDVYKILRPLLYLSKEDIYEYAKTYNIPYREDYTNRLDDYTRNRYRKYLLPFLKEEKDDVHLKFLDYSETLLEHYQYITNIVDSTYIDIVSNNKVHLTKFNNLDEFIKKELLKRYLFNNYGEDITKISNNHLNICLNFIRDGLTNSSIDLPNNYHLFKDYDYFELRNKTENIEYDLELIDKIELINGKTIEIVNTSEDTSNFTTYLASNELSLPLRVRSVKPGDKMMIKNMSGHKKISDIFTDEKINLMMRKTWPVVVDSDNKIIWLPGLKKTYFDRKNTGKYDIILKYY